jgi:hypothetical protein
MANYHLELHPKRTLLRSIGSPLPSKGRGEGEGCVVIHSDELTPVTLELTRGTLEPLTLIVSPLPRREATEWASWMKSEMI